MAIHNFTCRVVLVTVHSQFLVCEKCIKKVATSNAYQFSVEYVVLYVDIKGT